MSGGREGDAARAADRPGPSAGVEHADGSDERENARERGLAVRRAVLGDAHVDRSLARATAFDARFQDFITRYAWGDVWSRPGLDRRTRSVITVAVLAAIGAEGELPLHVRGALRNGLSPDEIAEILLHTAVYAGVPRANSAFAIARRLLEEEGLAEATPPGGPEAGAPEPGAPEPRGPESGRPST